MKRLGIYGGSFSPPHLGHLHAAEQFYDEACLDELVIMPAGRPPHKALDGGAANEDRLIMCRLLFEKDRENGRNIMVSDYEIQKQGASYTVLTLEHHSCPNTELFFLCGSDMFLSLDTWHMPARIFALATIFCCSREEDDMAELTAKKSFFEKKFGAKIILSRSRPLPVSSSELRCKLMLGEDTEGLLSKEIQSYVFHKGLYDTAGDLPNLRSYVKNALSPARFAHVLGVEKECVFLGGICGMTKEELTDLRRAALLHDITHEKSTEEQLAILCENGMEITNEHREHKNVLHQYSGAVFVKKEFDYSKAVTDAIACHTTGSTNMSLTDRILCLADYIEEGRKYPDCVDLRNRVHGAINGENAHLVIEEAMLIYFERTLAHLLQKGAVIHPQTDNSYRKLLENTLVKTRIL